jgi:DNA-binding transcriptional ArsR family regulator
MFSKYPVAEVAGLFADPARIAMLMSLLDGSSRPAGELARTAGVSPQAATAHLSKLTEGGILTLSSEGRHRYFRLASPEVGIALEALAATTRPAPVRPLLKRTGDADMLRYARTCYDHLAGTLGVRLATTLQNQGIIQPQQRNFTVTPKGEQWFQEHGCDITPCRARRRCFARRCLDWTERQHHLGGTVGASLLTHFFHQGWIVRHKEGRALRVTAAGQHELDRLIQI